MKVRLKNDQLVELRSLNEGDEQRLLRYFNSLSSTFKKRFSPHELNEKGVATVLNLIKQKSAMAFVASAEGELAGYYLACKGLSDNDKKRLQSTGITERPDSDYSFAPSIAEQYHGTGLAGKLFDFMKSHLSKFGIKRFVLLGGVQSDNVQAIRFYEKCGFVNILNFERDGSQNYMMILEIN